MFPDAAWVFFRTSKYFVTQISYSVACTLINFSFHPPSAHSAMTYFPFNYIMFLFVLGAAPMDAISDYFDSRAWRSEGGGSDRGGLGFTRSLRRTLPFQLVPQPPLAYARSNSWRGLKYQLKWKHLSTWSGELQSAAVTAHISLNPGIKIIDSVS